MKGTTARRVAWTLWALLGVEATASLTLVAFGGIASGLGHAALTVDSAPGGGTRVSGRVPAGAAVPLG